ncbi:HNH endonuclease [Rhodococcus pyridinivorans]|uniref:HNH endonuclease signature motif containing protein n=1 Tax=Rhodococcus TaxID=1827 RepID=UPI000A063820|nr:MULTISPECIES: HNH endonuclease [Rhodococcus]UPK63777.1 HNH endonuclease [Rhodococcus pyridinivorans]UVT26094.1 HNH endonuclease [Rhodococcus pyridinivorans]
MMRPVKYTKEILEEAVVKSTSVAGVLRHLGLKQSGGAHTHISRRIRRLGIDTSHFTGQAHQKGRPPRNRLAWTEILTLKPVGSNRQSPKRLRRALVESGRPHKCEGCGIEPMWCGAPLTFHIDHIDGNPHDSRPHNVRFLCPNCHSQTPTWAGRRRFTFGEEDQLS